MDLRDKLRSFNRNYSISSDPDNRSTDSSSLKRKIDIEDIIPGSYRQTSYGSSFVGERWFPLDYTCGSYPIFTGFDSSPNQPLAWLAKDEELLSMDLRTVAFLDTETTGLAGGAGTYVFLIGIGYFEGDSFKVEQYFLRDYNEELAMFSAFGELLPRFDGIVTFNGKTFDIPLIETRFNMVRRDLMRMGIETEEVPLRDLLHLDLLHCARRLWKARLTSCSLTSLEENILGLYREDDVPGALIPSLYFKYLQDEDARILEGVFTHNLQDILSLLALTGRMCQMVQNPKGADIGEPLDLFSLARLYEDIGLNEMAIETYNMAKDRATPYVKLEVMRNLSFLYKRLGAIEEAVAIWESFIHDGRDILVYPYVELAKYYEHKERDYGKAKEYTEGAIAITQRFRNNIKGSSSDLLDLNYRLDRLTRKMSLAKRG